LDYKFALHKYNNNNAGFVGLEFYVARKEAL